jgi:Zn-dependent peptidase ImmA (M78 family)
MLILNLFEKWSNKYKKSINCANPKGFSQKAHCAGRKKHNESVDHKEPEFIQALRDFLPIAVDHLKLKSLPKIHLQKQVNDVHVASFGGYDDNEQAVTLVINNRQPADILRTLAHELVHWGQGQNNEIDADSWQDGSDLENEANAVAGVIMREFARQHPQHLELHPIVFECDAKNAVPELKAALTKRKTELKNADAKVAYDKIDKIMTRIAQTYNISGQKLHDLWTERYGEIPDTWVLGESTKVPNKVLTINGLTVKFFDNVIAFYKDHNLLWGKEGDYSNPNNNSIHTAKQIASWLTQKIADKKLLSRTNKTLDENFADGKGPGRPGDSQRHGISKGATMAELEKAAKASGRKGQLARWQINMRRGKKK